MSDSPILAAERAILGIVIDHPEKAAEAFARVDVGDFTGPNGLIAEAIHGMRLERKPIEPGTVLAELSRRGTLGRVGGGPYLASLMKAYTVAESIGTYVDEVVAAARLRRLWQLGTRTAQLAEQFDADPRRIAATVVEQAQAVVDGVEAEGDVTTPTLREFLDVEDKPYEWVVPGLLERGDRMLLTGTEGLGKSVLFRQIGICTAAGVHPFTHRPITPQRVLIVDCENSATQMRRALRPLAIQARARGGSADETLYVEARPEGMDLTKPEDEAWLVRRVAALQPALLLTGSLYRLHTDDPNAEKPARAVSRVLDRCRAAANCAVVVEAHAGHGNSSSPDRPIRPTGTSLWLRWPEFGYGMRPSRDYDPTTRVVDLVPWRGDRDEREWPRRLKAGSVWPWEIASVDGWRQAS